MATISGGKPTPQISERTNAVLSVAPAKIYAISLTDSSGKMGTALAITFGKQQDGRPFVGILMDNNEMQSNLRIAAPDIREAVIRRLASEDSSAPTPETSADVLGALGGSFPVEKPKRGKKG